MTVKSNKTLILYQQALEILANVASLHKDTSFEQIKLLDGSNRVLAEEILSPINVPSFNNSAMDGFAIQSKIINKIVAEHGLIKLQVTGSIQAGDDSEIHADAETHLAWEIMTGAPVPDAFDAVIPIENVTITKSNHIKYITVFEHVLKGGNIRKLGTDYTTNQLVTSKHVTIQAQHIMALATVGIKQVMVVPKVRVAIISTGNELAKQSNQSLNPGKIHNSNQPYLKAYCRSINCDPVFVGRCKDNSEDFNLLIETALESKAKIIFSTGAVSMGKYDFIPQTLLHRGATLHFHKSKIKPGKPILFAELTNGTVYFGLPGNPIAAASGMRFFVAPFIRHIQGLQPEKTIKAQLITAVHSKKGFRTFAKALANISETGQLMVEMLQDQGSYQSHSFAQSNCWLIIPENKGDIAAGEVVEIAPMTPNQLLFQ